RHTDRLRRRERPGGDSRGWDRPRPSGDRRHGRGPPDGNRRLAGGDQREEKRMRKIVPVVSNMSSRGRRATVGVVALNGLLLSVAVACGSGAPPVATGSVAPASASATSTPSAEPLD